MLDFDEGFREKWRGFSLATVSRILGELDISAKEVEENPKLYATLYRLFDYDRHCSKLRKRFYSHRIAVPEPPSIHELPERLSDFKKEEVFSVMKKFRFDFGDLKGDARISNLIEKYINQRHDLSKQESAVKFLLEKVSEFTGKTMRLAFRKKESQIGEPEACQTKQ